MLKFIHIALAFVSLLSFLSRVWLLNSNPQTLQRKIFKILPHIIDTLLLISGATLVLQNQWLSGQHVWLNAKLLTLLGYIGLGIVVMRKQAPIRWIAFAGALLCFCYVVAVAIVKRPLLFI
jgi:uncharacterized membrane protein SirB2